jgi:hypothetical protein
MSRNDQSGHDGHTVDPTEEPAGADARRLPGSPDPSRDPVARPGDDTPADAAPTPPAAARHPANRSETQEPAAALDEPAREDETTEPG